MLEQRVEQLLGCSCSSWSGRGAAEGATEGAVERAAERVAAGVEAGAAAGAAGCFLTLARWPKILVIVKI